MVWWILAGGFLIGLALLALVARAVYARLGPLQRALGRLQAKAAEAQALQDNLAQLQERMETMQEQVAARGDRPGGLGPEQPDGRR